MVNVKTIYERKFVVKKNEYFEVGDIVNMHCGEQGIVLEILDDEWVYLLQCSGHVEKAYMNDIWKTDFVAQSGKEALHEFFMKTLGYSAIYEEEHVQYEKGSLTPEGFIEPNDGDVPF